MRVWCEGRGLYVGGLLTLDTAWRLAVGWYRDRLEPTARRKTLDETWSNVQSCQRCGRALTQPPWGTGC